MRIKSLTISNYRALRHLDLTDLQDVVILVGANGCGKSTVFDAFRLLKSWYGEYSINEIEGWYQERGINARQHISDYSSEFFDKGQPLRIAATIEFRESEKSFLRENFESTYWELIWRNGHSPSEPPPASIEIQRRLGREGKRLEAERKEVHQDFLKELELGSHQIALEISPSGTPRHTRSILCEHAFSTWEPGSVGIVDFHGPDRKYDRTRVGQVSRKEKKDRYRSHALYNYASKLSNIKNELHAGFVQELIAKAARAETKPQSDLALAMSEMFARFFPNKSFDGPAPTADGSLSFDVTLTSGATHDIDDLSSGEKELIFGYLRLKNERYKSSVILMDEPELHLNPALLHNLPEFYYKEFGRASNNQIWMATHSDTLVRQSVSMSNFCTYHIRGGNSVDDGENQAYQISLENNLDSVLVDLIGDVAVFRPKAKVVIFEGGTDTGFDQHLVKSLYPEFKLDINTISATDKMKVRNLHDLLDQLAEKGDIDKRFYSVVDRDTDDDLGRPSKSVTRFSWDVYHIENYLLDEECILQAICELDFRMEGKHTETSLAAELKICAGETIPELVAHRTHVDVSSAIRSMTRLRRQTDVIQYHESVTEMSKRLQLGLNQEFATENLDKRARAYEAELRRDLSTGRWKTNFRGRDILNRLAGRLQLNYESLRNLIVVKLTQNQRQPQGMTKIVRSILDD